MLSPDPLFSSFNEEVPASSFCWIGTRGCNMLARPQHQCVFVLFDCWFVLSLLTILWLCCGQKSQKHSNNFRSCGRTWGRSSSAVSRFHPPPCRCDVRQTSAGPSPGFLGSAGPPIPRRRRTSRSLQQHQSPDLHPLSSAWRTDNHFLFSGGVASSHHQQAQSSVASVSAVWKSGHQRTPETFEFQSPEKVSNQLEGSVV